MRTNEERKELIFARSEEIKRHSELKKRRIKNIGITAAAACICVFLMTAVCDIMPEIQKRIGQSELSNIHGTASLIGNSAAVGYIITACLCLGSMFCDALILHKQEEQESGKEIEFV